MKYNFALVIPMANEESDFHPFIRALKETLDFLRSGDVYLVIDQVSKDNTLLLCRRLAQEDSRFHAQIGRAHV